MMNLLVLRCKSITLTKDFYEKYGFIFIQEQHGSSPTHYSTSINGLTLELYPSTQNFPVDSCRLGFSLSNFRELSESMSANIKQRNGNDVFITIDPDGRKVVITQYNDQNINTWKIKKQPISKAYSNVVKAVVTHF